MMKRVKALLAALSAACIFAGCGGAFAAERVYILPSTTNAKAPKGNVFQLKGNNNKYILLDSTEEGYFVLSEKFCTLRSYSRDGNAVAFDPENENSIAYWLNNDYLNDTALSGRLPQVMLDNLVECEYVTEGGGDFVDFKSDYTVKCKVVLLSQTEWSKYNSKFGYADDASSGFWFLRTVRALTGAPLVASVNAPNSGLTVEGRWTSVIGIRPAFYLSADFFSKASLDMENTGDVVKSVVRKEYDIKMLKKVYTDEEMSAVFDTDIAPAAEVVRISGRGIVGETVTGRYEFVSLDERSEDGTLIQWQRSADKKVWSTILGADTCEYVPAENDVGYYIRMKVSPMTAAMAGESYVSVPLACKIRAISKPRAANVTVVSAGAVKPGDILDATYSFYDENRDICSETEYVWESRRGDVTETVGNTRYFRPSGSEAGKYVRVGVIPKKRTSSADGRKTVCGDIAYSDWGWVENLPAAVNVGIVRNMNLTISASKTDGTISVKSAAVPAGQSERLTAQYELEESGGYEIVCEWQGSDSEYGAYGCIEENSGTLEIQPDKAMWVRAKVYTRNAAGRGRAAYSAPVLIGADVGNAPGGEYTLTQGLTGGKRYEIWILNDAGKGSYAYSFKIEGDNIPQLTSERYLIKSIDRETGRTVIGTLTGERYSGDACFKAGEISPASDMMLTISDALTTAAVGGDFPITRARVFVVEK